MIFVFLFLQKVLSGQITDVSISMLNYSITAQTTYQINIKLLTSIKTTGSISIIFPSIYTNLSQGAYQCSNSSQQCSCVMQGQTLVITSCFSESSNIFKLFLAQVKNPSIAKVTDPFKIYTYDSSSLIDSTDSGPNVTITAGTLSQASLSCTGKVSDLSVWTLSISISQAIPAGGFIFLAVPTWNSFLGTPKSLPQTNNWTYCSGSLSCSETVLLKTSLSCQCNGNGVNITVPQSLIGSVIININSLLNPPSTSSVFGFIIQTGSSDGFFEKSGNLSVSAQTPALIKVNSFLLTNSYYVSAYSNYSFQLTVNTPVPQNSFIYINFTSDFQFSSNLAVFEIFGISKSTLTTNGLTVVLNGGFSSAYLLENTLIYFNLNSVKNPYSSKPAGPIIVTIFDSNKGQVACVSSGIVVNAYPGTLQQVNIKPYSEFASVTNFYTFSFVLSHNLSPGAGIYVVFPNEIVPANYSGPCLYIPDSSALDKSSYCTITNNKYLVVSNGLTNGNKTQTVNFQINNITNSISTSRTSKFFIATCPDSFCSYFIDNFTSFDLAFSANLINSVTLFNSNKTTGASTGILFSLVVGSTIPQKSYIEIQIPAEVSVSSLTCVAVSGISSLLQCVNSGVINVTGGFELSDFNPGVLAFNISNFKNPQSTRPSSAFKIYVKYQGSVVLYREDCVVQATEPHLLLSASVSAGNNVVGCRTSLQFSIQVFNQIALSSVSIVQMSELWLSDSTCSGPQVVSCTPLPYGILVNLSLNQSSSYTITLNNISMPNSTKPINSFQLLTFESNYAVDYMNTSIILQMTVPGNFISAKLDLSNPGISETSDYTFNLKNTHAILNSGYVEVVLPSEISFQDPTTCLFSQKPTLCKRNSLGILVSISSDLYFSFFNITLKNVLNPAQTGTSGLFTVTSFTQDLFEIDQVELTTVYTCSSPCNTCDLLSTNCTSCSNLYLYDNGCHTSCKSGFFGSSFSCEPCISPCSSCVSSSECTACVSPLVLSGSQCLPACGQGYYNSSGVCSKCSSICKSCDSQGCTECNKGYLYKNQCLDICPGYAINSNCYDCITGCSNCSTPSTCNNCSTGYIFYAQTCLTSCPIGFFQANSSCQPCPAYCKSCTSLNTCIQCNDPYSLFNSSCKASCPNRYFDNKGICTQCQPGCNNCNSSQCFACQDGLSYFNGSCLASCPDMVTVSVSGICQPCSVTCLTCSNTQTNCLSCPVGQYLFNNTCISQCPSPLVSYNSKCVSCDESCSICSNSPSNCTECKESFFLYNSMCVSECPANITVPQGKTCQKCTDSCLHCINYTNYCLSCVVGTEYLGTCIESCPVGFSSISGHCEAECSPGCTAEKLGNSLCDPECDSYQCNYDNFTCSNFKYSDSLDPKQTPFPSTIVSVSSAGISGISKYFVPATSFVSSSVSLISVTESGSWVNLAYQISLVDYTHGRSLSEVDVKTEIALGLILVFLCMQFLINLIFVLVYYFVVLNRDLKLRAWSRSHKCAKVLIISIACLVNFKIIKIIISSTFGLNICKADIEKRSNLLKPLLVMSYVSIITTSVPIICILVYILSVYSSGNPVFIFALDTLITTLISTLMMIPDIIIMNKEIRGEAVQAVLPEYLTTYDADANKNIKVEPANAFGSQDIDKTYMNTDRSLIAPNIPKLENYEMSCQTPDDFFLFVKSSQAKTQTPDLIIDQSFETQNKDLNLEESKISLKENLEKEDCLDIPSVSIEGTSNPFEFQRVFESPSFLSPVTFTNKIRLSDPTNFSFERVSFDLIQPKIKTEFLNIESVSELSIVPAKKEPVRITESDEEPQQFDFEIFDSSKEYIDDENEPQLLETITEEDELDLSNALVDTFDLECVKVPHKASGLNVLVKKSFAGAELEDGSPLNEGNYSLEDIDPSDVRIGIIRRMNSDSLIKAKRDFKKATIVDVELRGGIWLVGRTVRSESDFDFGTAKLCKDGRTVLANHKVSGIPFLIKKSFVGALKENNEILDFDPKGLCVDEIDLHSGYFEGSVYRRSFVGGLVSAVLDEKDVELYQIEPVLNDQTAYFEKKSVDVSDISENSESVRYTRSEFMSTFTEGFIQQDEKVPVSAEVQTDMKLQNISSSLSLSHADSIMIKPLRFAKINSVLNVEDKINSQKSLKFKKIKEEPQPSRPKTVKKKKKIKSKGSSKFNSPRGKIVKGINRSESVKSSDSNKSIEAIYLQRLRRPKEKGEKHLIAANHTPADDSNLSLSIQMSLKQLNLGMTRSNFEVSK